MPAPTCRAPSATWNSPYTRYPTAHARALRWKRTGMRANNPTTARRAPPATTRARIRSTLLRMTSVPAAIPNRSAAGSGSARVSTSPYISPASARNIRPKMAMATSRSTPLLEPVMLPAQAREKGGSHRRRRAPDVALGRAIDGKNGHLIIVAFEVPGYPAQCLGGGKRFQGHREDFLYLVWGEHQLGLGWQQPDERAHAEVGWRYVHLLQLPDNLDQAGAKVDLLLRLPQPLRETIPTKVRVLPTSIHHPDASMLRPAAFAARCGPTGLRLSAHSGVCLSLASTA